MRNKYAKCILGKKNSGSVIEGNNTECRQQIHQEMYYNTVPGGRNSMHSLKGEGPSRSDFGLSFILIIGSGQDPFPSLPCLEFACVWTKRNTSSHTDAFFSTFSLLVPRPQIDSWDALLWVPKELAWKSTTRNTSCPCSNLPGKVGERWTSTYSVWTMAFFGLFSFSNLPSTRDTNKKVIKREGQKEVHRIQNSNKVAIYWELMRPRDVHR